ncbi:hypothetical protein C8R43DRAFT_961788 [Mycena crocata]|nr:hypothetical protein C8R43DRAFT_961788 [Mycena crocata]
MVAALTRMSLSRITAAFGLRLRVIQLLQAGTCTLLTGDAVSKAIDLDVSSTYFPLVFHAPKGEGKTVHSFISLVTGATHIREGLAGNGITVWSIKAAGRMIRIIETKMDARLSINSEGSSLNMAWSDERKIKHCYAQHIASKTALVTPLTLPLYTSMYNHVEAWRIVRHILARGHTPIAEFTKPHHCGTDPSCPATARTTLDGGVLTLKLPPLNLRYTVAGCTPGIHRSDISASGYSILYVSLKKRGQSVIVRKVIIE